ncbi:MAG: Cobalt-zinc-cadmium resistance protein CzcB [Planctomycetota bacterium]|jgi:cobalt-zinc-cadmium efflux system membrane fusion protein
MKSSKLRTLLFSTVAIGGSCGVIWWTWGRTPAGDTLAETSAEGVESVAPAAATARVELTGDKVTNAKFEEATAETTELLHEHLVPGRIQYDDRRHILVRSATDGIISRLAVKPGQRVEKGDVLIEISSPEVGDARANVLQRQAELRLAIESRDWEKSTFEGLSQLSEAIRNRKTVDQIRTQFQKIVLGNAREVLLSGYSDLLLAETQLRAAEENAANGVVPAKVVSERKANLDQFEARLTSAMEERTFLANQARLQSEAKVQDAERRLRVSLQQVRTLLGAAVDSPESEPLLETMGEEAGPEQLSLIKLKAPFSGTIEECRVSSTERVEAGESLMVLADTTTLWVSADLRQREWRALRLQPGDTVRVVTEIEGVESREAVVHFAGREVDPATNAVPLVSLIDNADGRLRPGMFVRVAIPVTDRRMVLTIPEGAVLEHDRKPFVFVPVGEHAYQRVDIEPGVRTNGVIEVLAGLKPGDRVISEGGFFLKSELLLGEAE